MCRAAAACCVRQIEPLMRALEEAKRAKEHSESVLASVRAHVAQTEARLQSLQRAYLVASAEKASVEQEAIVCRDR